MSGRHRPSVFVRLAHLEVVYLRTFSNFFILYIKSSTDFCPTLKEVNISGSLYFFAELPTFHFQLKVERDEMTTNYQDEDS